MRLRPLRLGIVLLSLVAACGDDVGAPSPDPPTVSTGEVASVTRDQAVVSGTVDPHGVDARYWFEYGLDTDYGTTTPDSSISNSAGGPQTVAMPLTGLSPSTLYYYRLAASSAGGTVKGDDATFRTLDPNLAPETLVTAAPPDTLETTVRWHLLWSGSDVDGVVSGYELRVADHGPDGILDPADSLGVPWTSTVVTDSVITWQVGLGSRTFFVRAFDNEGARDPTPAFRSIEALGGGVGSAGPVTESPAPSAEID